MPACVWGLMLAHMAGPLDTDTSQALTYLYLLFIPILLYHLVIQLIHTDRATVCIFLQGTAPWMPRCTYFQAPCKHVKKKFWKPMVRIWQLQSSQQTFGIGMTHLFPIAQATYLIGCCIESFVRATIGFLKWLQLPKPPWPWITKHQAFRLAFQAKCHQNHQTPLVHFDMDSIPIGINNHASRCMGNDARLFEDLHPSQNKQVRGINAGLEIKGIGTFVFTIEDDNGKKHEICILNSLHVPDLKLCLLSPQHWAQEAGDDYPMPNGTRMENMASHCILIWKQGSCRKLITFNSATNTPIFFTAPSSGSYHAFISTFHAIATFFM